MENTEERGVHFSGDVENPIETDLRKLVDGYAVPIKTVDVGEERLGTYVPVTKQTVCYIVAGVIINSSGQVLMMQEAKFSCHGLWYLPAGRVERGESLYEACKREVEEETGLKCEPQTLICVEFGSGCWYRFTFAAKVTGGKLKTLDNKDRESLQAEWIDYDHIKNKTLQLRARDVIPLIKLASKYQSKPPHERHPSILPVVQSHKHLINRPVIVHRVDAPEGDVYILVNTNGTDHIPTGYENRSTFLATITTQQILREAYGGKYKFKPRICGVLSVEYNSTQHSDLYGCCLTILVSLDCEEVPKLETDQYKWMRVKDSQLLEDLSPYLQRRIIPFVDLHL